MRSNSLAFALLMAVSFAGQLSAGDSLLVAKWDFDAEEPTPLTAHGGVERDKAGPVPPEHMAIVPNAVCCTPDQFKAKPGIALRQDGAQP